ncbi:MAG TPA: diguanylate cyclase, partial [Anaerolineales bacterium]|nr:diguanylate cyclase [Anaerolineales bacterium]
IKYLEAYTEDISQRRQAEMDLQAERDFAMTVMNTMGQGLTVVDVQSRFIFINPAYARISGYALSDLLGKTPDDLTFPEDKAVLNRAKTERKLGLTTSYETRLVRADGSLVPVLITGAPRWRGNLMDGSIAVITDLTERKQMEAELTRMNERLELQLAEMRELQTLLQEQAIRDPLTQLYNRRYLNEILPREVVRAQRNGTELGVLMIDIDLFKNINDSYGHKAGDETLQAISQAIVINLRASDIVCRFGGEEILCLLIGTNEWIATRRAEYLREEISQLPVITNHSEVRVTVSIGVAIFIPPAMDIHAVIKAADVALYQAKAEGRNCVRVAGKPF